MRKIVWFTIGFGGACILGTYLLRSTPLLLCAIAGLFLLAGTMLFRHKRVLRPIATVLLGFAVGCCVFYGYDSVILAPARAADGTEENVVFRAGSYSWNGTYGSTVDGEIELEGQTYKMRLYLSEYTEITPGDTLTLSVLLRLTDEGGGHEPTFHRTNGILLLGYQRSDLQMTDGIPAFRDFPVVFRERLLNILEQSIPEDAAGLAKALLLADKTDISYETSTDFSTTGISHIVAVSGLHVSILFGLVYLVSGKRRYLTALIGIPCVIFFAALSGFTPSVTRASIMQILMMLALLFNREYDPPTALTGAALAMLVWNPLVIASVGFQLSVLSVTGIFLFSERIRKWIDLRLPKWKKRSVQAKLGRWFSSCVSVTLSATTMTAPLVAYYYGTVSLVGVLTNLLVLPVISLIFYGAMVVCLLGLLPVKAAGVVGWLLAWPVRYVCAVAHVLAQIPLAAVYTASPYIVIWLVFVYCLIGLLFTKHPRPLISLCCLAIGLVAALGLSWAEPLMDDYRVTVLDVGQGQCILLQADGATYMVDCGGSYDSDAGTSAAQYLLSQGIRRIDGLILTHYDRDHAGGVKYLAYQIGIDCVYLPDTPDSDGLQEEILQCTGDTEQVWVTEDLKICFGGTEISLFAPEAAASGNESCVAVLFQRGKYDTLITGDLSAFRERQLIAKVELPDVEVLIAGHHGSKYSTCQELLDAAAPDVVMISVGRDNSYGHPAQETLDALDAFGCKVCRTDENGNLIYRR